MLPRLATFNVPNCPVGDNFRKQKDFACQQVSEGPQRKIAPKTPKKESAALFIL